MPWSALLPLATGNTATTIGLLPWFAPEDFSSDADFFFCLRLVFRSVTTRYRAVTCYLMSQRMTTSRPKTRALTVTVTLRYIISTKPKRGTRKNGQAARVGRFEDLDEELARNKGDVLMLRSAWFKRDLGVGPGKVGNHWKREPRRSIRCRHV